MKLNSEYSARLLSAKRSPLGIDVETYAVHPVGEYCAVAQIELFRARDGWFFWGASHWRPLPRMLGQLCAEARNRE